MKKVRATIAVFALFSLACVGNQVTYKLLDTGEPLGGLDSDADSDADSDSDTDSDADADVTGFSGTITYAFGFRPTPGEFDCELVFNTIGTPTELACPECEWTLQFDLVYDDELSYDERGCYDDNDPVFTLGYDADYGGDAGYEVIWYFDLANAEWYPTWLAYADGEGGIGFGGGYSNYYYPYNGVPYYYTKYWYGTGTLSY